jgi:dTDP-4-amino-4,6-dideoxygalactose transaminase
MSVPLFDLTRQFQQFQPQLEAAALELLASGSYVLGPAVDAFEAEAATFLGSQYTIGVANGTDAIQIALRSVLKDAQLQPGDEVITSPFSFYSAAEVIADLGAKPVFVDIDEDTFNLSASKIEAAITPRTRAIIPVHIFGHPAAMPEIMEIARKHDLKVVEDCAQSWGSTLDGRMTGTFGDAGTFSFFPTKNLGACGEGGLICTDSYEWAEKSKQLRVHGQSKRYIYDEIGYNSRLHAMQAALLRVKLPHSQAFNDARRRHAAQYRELLAGTPFIVPVEREGARHIYHQYTLRVPKEVGREKVMAKLAEKGIGHAIYYPMPLHVQPIFENLGLKHGDLPVVERITEEVLSLPIFPELRESEVEEVAAALKLAL